MNKHDAAVRLAEADLAYFIIAPMLRRDDPTYAEWSAAREAYRAVRDAPVTDSVSTVALARLRDYFRKLELGAGDEIRALMDDATRPVSDVHCPSERFAAYAHARRAVEAAIARATTSEVDAHAIERAQARFGRAVIELEDAHNAVHDRPRSECPHCVRVAVAKAEYKAAESDLRSRADEVLSGMRYV